MEMQAAAQPERDRERVNRSPGVFIVKGSRPKTMRPRRPAAWLYPVLVVFATLLTLATVAFMVLLTWMWQQQLFLSAGIWGGLLLVLATLLVWLAVWLQAKHMRPS